MWKKKLSYFLNAYNLDVFKVISRIDPKFLYKRFYIIIFVFFAIFETFEGRVQIGSCLRNRTDTVEY